MKQTRRLVVIMFTDIVGYTAMMGQDEDHGIRAVSEHRKVLEQTRGLLSSGMSPGFRSY